MFQENFRYIYRHNAHNKPRASYNKEINETSLSGHYKLILSLLFWSYFSRIPPITIQYRISKTLNTTKFLHVLVKELLKGNMYKSNRDIFVTFTETFQGVLYNHTPLKV